MSVELPKDWKWVKLGEVLDIQGGSQPPKSNFVYEPKKGYIQLLQIRDFGEKGVPTYVPKNRVTKFCKKDDIMIARYGASLGRIMTGLEGAYNVAMAKVIDEKELFEKRYILYLLRTQIFQTPLKLLSRSAQNGFSKSEISHIQLPLPTKLIQQAIVSKIEELFSELDKGVEQLKTAQQQLKTYRQSVLKWAFEGKLTNTNVKEGELPEGWNWMKFGELFSENPQNGLYKSSTEYGSGTPIIRIDGFYDGSIVDDYEYKRVRLSEEEISRYLISVGDILVNRVNSMPYLGKCGIVKHLKEKTVFESNIMKVRLDAAIALPEYFTMYLSSKKGISELRKNAKQAVNQASINQTDVSNVIVPLPSIREQNKIVQEIESRLSVADKMEEGITQSLQQSEALRQSILKKAFEGRLV